MNMFYGKNNKFNKEIVINIKLNIIKDLEHQIQKKQLKYLKNMI